MNDPTNKFAVSDDCKVIRINNIIIHKHSNGNFYPDTLPAEVSIVNTLEGSAFSADFNLLITNLASYRYTPKTSSANGTYTKI